MQYSHVALGISEVNLFFLILVKKKVCYFFKLLVVFKF